MFVSSMIRAQKGLIPKNDALDPTLGVVFLTDLE
jgi:hypothetical protein